MALPRRTFLRGIGATLALPLLDAMVPALTALAQTAAKPVPRIGFIYMPNGVMQNLSGRRRAKAPASSSRPSSARSSRSATACSW